jgi:hypothetical protein
MSDWRFIVGGAAVDPETDYKFIITQYQGAGMAEVENISTSFGLLDGSIFQRTRATDRSLTLTGIINGSNASALHLNRKGLINAVKPDRSASQNDPLVIQYLGGASTLQGSAYYSGGLSLGQVDATKERVALQFAFYDPYFEKTTSSSATLTTQATISNANYILQRAACGAWGALGSGMNGAVQALVTTTAGILWAGGAFTTASGTTVNRIANWNGTTWAAASTGMNAGVNSLAVAANNDVWAGGAFTTSGGTSSCRIARWNGSTWVTTGCGGNGDVFGVTVANNGDVWIGGEFITVGTQSRLRVAKYNGTAWSGASTGMDDIVNALDKDQAGNIYAGGRFSTAGGTTATRVAKWNGTTWTALGSGLNDEVRVLKVGPDATLYAGGDFLTAGGVAASRIAQWNGTAWTPLSTGVDNQVYTITTDPAGLLYAGGAFTTAGGVTLMESFARYKGSTWFVPDVNLPGTTTVQALDYSASTGLLTIGFNTTGTASAAGVTAVTSGGTATTYPILTASAPTSSSVRLVQLINFTTGDAIYFDLVLASSEVVTLDLRPGKKTFTSNIRGNIISTVLPGSNVATWKLLPGSNNVSFWLTGGSGAAKLTWTERFWSIDT